MIRFDLRQTYSGTGALYEVALGPGQQYAAQVPLHFLRTRILVSLNGEPLYEAGFELAEHYAGFFQLGEERAVKPFSVFDAAGHLVGGLCIRRPSVFSGYRYFDIALEGQSYRAYEVWLGKEGLKLPLYHEHRQIALLEKPPIVRNNLDEYHVRLLDESLAGLCVLLGVYFDCLRFSNRGEYSARKVQASYNTTVNRRLRSMYDPAFKEQFPS